MKEAERNKDEPYTSINMRSEEIKTLPCTLEEEEEEMRVKAKKNAVKKAEKKSAVSTIGRMSNDDDTVGGGEQTIPMLDKEEKKELSAFVKGGSAALSPKAFEVTKRRIDSSMNIGNETKKPKREAGESALGRTSAAAASKTFQSNNFQLKSNTSDSSTKEKSGRWSEDKHKLFLQGLEQHGRKWKKIAVVVETRTRGQIKTHAQKYFAKLERLGQEQEVTVVRKSIEKTTAEYWDEIEKQSVLQEDTPFPLPHNAGSTAAEKSEEIETDTEEDVPEKLKGNDEVVVPEGVEIGDSFSLLADGQEVTLMCPEGKGGDDTVTHIKPPMPYQKKSTYWKTCKEAKLKKQLEAGKLVVDAPQLMRNLPNANSTNSVSGTNKRKAAVVSAAGEVDDSMVPVLREEFRNGRRLCSCDGCSNFAMRGGVCTKHGAKKKPCSHEGCSNNALQGGVCIKHGAKIERKRKSCGHEGCNKKAQSKGMCDRHSGRKRKSCGHDGLQYIYALTKDAQVLSKKEAYVGDMHKLSGEVQDRW